MDKPNFNHKVRQNPTIFRRSMPILSEVTEEDGLGSDKEKPEDGLSSDEERQKDRQ